MEKGLEIETVFAKPTISDWIDKINKDLKGVKTADELQYAIEDGLTISALQEYEGKELNSISRERDHLVACHVDTSADDANTIIKDLLNVGVNTLILNAYATVDYSVVLEGVVLDYIQIAIYPMDESAEQKVLDYLKKMGADMNKVYAPSTNRNLLHIPFTGSISDQLSSLLQKVDNNSHEDLLLIMDGQKDFLSEVAKIRAAHILLANLSKATGRKIHYNLLSHTKASKEGVHELIQSSYMGLAAIIGEADGIVAVALDPKYKLNAVHTYNLLTMESYLGKVNDPAAGSNLIEKMTEEICEKGWSKFVKTV